MGQRADLTACAFGIFESFFFGSHFHFLLEFLHERFLLAAEKEADVADSDRVFLRIGLTRTDSRTKADLAVEARAARGFAGLELLRARGALVVAIREDATHKLHRFAQREALRKRAEKLLHLPSLPVGEVFTTTHDEQARECFFGHHEVIEAAVVLVDDVVGRRVLLDEIRFEDHRFEDGIRCFPRDGVGFLHHGRDGGGTRFLKAGIEIAAHAVAQHRCLADIQNLPALLEAVDARCFRKVEFLEVVFLHDDSVCNT